MTLVAVGGLALVVELLNIFGKEFFNGGRAQEQLKESIRKTQSEIRAADKKLDSMRATRRTAARDLEKVMAKIEDLEKAMRRPSDAPPLLVHSVSGPGFGNRYRATITKTLPGDADEHQVLLWKQQNVVDVAGAPSPEEAAEAARRQFPESHGYAFGPFNSVGASRVESAA